MHLFHGKEGRLAVYRHFHHLPAIYPTQETEDLRDRLRPPWAVCEHGNSRIVVEYGVLKIGIM
jgi:hypothetical protein